LERLWNLTGEGVLVKRNDTNWAEKHQHMKEVIAALVEQRDAINRALEALEAVGMYGLPIPGPDIARQSFPAAPGAFSCEAHPKNSIEFSKKGVCKLCQSERMKGYWSERRKETAVEKPPRARRSGVALELVYSKKQRCPKCGLTTRFQRSRMASQDDFWTCLGTGCELKIGNYKIPVDKDEKGTDDREFAEVAL
jgi:hypothetical protein